MAKYYRFMNFSEFLKMSFGEEITPFMDYSSAYLTTSKGVCFLGDKSIDENDEKRKTLQSLREYMGNCVSDHVLVEFESSDSDIIHESVGKYKEGDLPEYWMKSYNCNNMIPSKYKIAMDSDLETQDWIDYDRNEILQNPKSILQQIADKRRNQKSAAVTSLEDWCSEFSLLSEGNNGWYIDRDLDSKTISLSYGDICSRDRNPIYSLCFKQESADQITRGLEKYRIANYSWSINGDAPDAWKDIPEKLSRLSNLQSCSSLPYSHSIMPNTICDYDYSLFLPHYRIAELMKYAILKATYPDIMSKYRLGFDGANPGRVFEPFGLPISNPYQTPPLRLDTLRINEVGFVMNNLYQNNPVFFSSQLKDRKIREEEPGSDKDKEEIPE